MLNYSCFWFYVTLSLQNTNVIFCGDSLDWLINFILFLCMHIKKKLIFLTIDSVMDLGCVWLGGYYFSWKIIFSGKENRINWNILKTIWLWVAKILPFSLSSLGLWSNLWWTSVSIRANLLIAFLFWCCYFVIVIFILFLLTPYFNFWTVLANTNFSILTFALLLLMQAIKKHCYKYKCGPSSMIIVKTVK